MKKYNIPGFTLVELIVVITILTILGTIGFLSFKNYAQSARNSARISDLKTIEKSMGLLETEWTRFPIPNNPINITYSGGLAWQQWTLWTWAIQSLRRVSNIPKDPVFKVDYTYSLWRSQNKYQIAWVQEWSIYYSQNLLSSNAYALSAKNLDGYVIWNYLSYAVPVISWADCYLITTPSMILSDIPITWVLLDGGIYNYSYRKSWHVPSNYAGVVEVISLAQGFQTNEVLDWCEMNTTWELNLYIAKLSTSFQGLSNVQRYESLIYNSNSNNFQRNILRNLEEHWVQVSQQLINIVESPLLNYTFTDIFLNTDGTSLVWSHNSWSGSWITLWAGSTTDYNIITNVLEKNGAAQTIVAPSPNPLITNENYTLSFDIENFASWDISAYLRYANSNNYYKLQLSSSGYQIIRNIWWVESILQTIVETIVVWSNIVFSISEDAVSFEVNGIEKENIVAWWLSATWHPAIMLENNWARIDNYSLIYR